MDFESSFFKIRAWGEDETALLPPLGPNDGALVRHDDEAVLEEFRCHVSLRFYNIGPDGKSLDKQFSTNWSMDKVDVTLTTERLVYIKRDFARGNVYIAPDGVGLALTALSKHRAKKRFEHTAYVGQLAFAYPMRVFVEQPKSIGRKKSPLVVIAFRTRSQFFRLECAAPPDRLQAIAKTFAQLVSAWRISAPSFERAPADVQKSLRSQAENPIPNDRGIYELGWWSQVN